MRKASEQMGISLDTLRRVENGAAPNPGRPGGLREDHALTIASFYGLKPWELWPISVGGDPDPKEKKAA